MNLSDVDTPLRSFKSIRSLLPSVQGKMTHNAIIKLLLDQGKDLQKNTPDAFAESIRLLERLCRTKQIPCETIYRTDNRSVALPDSLVFNASVMADEGPSESFGKTHSLALLLPRSFARFLVDALLGAAPTASGAPFSVLEQSVLNKFLEQFAAVFLNARVRIQSIQNVDKIAGTTTNFIWKTKFASFSFQIIVPVARFDEPVETNFSTKLAAQLAAASLPVVGTVEQTIPLARFMTLKKGDTIHFSEPAADTRVRFRTLNHMLLTGYLRLAPDPQKQSGGNQ